MIDDIEAAVIIAQWDGPRMIAEQEPAGGIPLDAHPPVFWVDFAVLGGDDLAQGLGVSVALVPALVDLVDYRQHAARQPVVEPTLQYCHEVQ